MMMSRGILGYTLFQENQTSVSRVLLFSYCPPRRREFMVKNMRTTTVLTSSNEFVNAFERCCRDYNALHIAVAWCGNPAHTLPYQHLDDFQGEIIATVGHSFNQTHPDAIQWLLKRASTIRVFRKEQGLFHPKIYFFMDGDRYALFVGSSNLTYAGFYDNFEVNVLIEGFISRDAADVRELQALLKTWQGPDFSIKPDKKWLDGYRRDHKRDREAQRKAHIKTEASEEENFGPNWLEKADWHTYYQKVIKGMKESNREIATIHRVLDAAAQRLTVPWATSYFKDPEKRRIIGGIKPYGPMGHVFASGGFGHLVAHRKQSWVAVVNAVNQIAKLEAPIDWSQLESQLHQLVSLGSSMKVWGRTLALVRPDLYCSVSSDPLRKELGKTLKAPAGRFADVDGYIALIKLLHSSPWFNSPKPHKNAQAAIWVRRVAFIDGIFWNREKK